MFGTPIAMSWICQNAGNFGMMLLLGYVSAYRVYIKPKLPSKLAGKFTDKSGRRNYGTG